MRLDQILGGKPLGVIVRLVIMSIVVGIILSALGVTPDNLFYKLSFLAERVYYMGWDAVSWGLGYFLIGAIIVVPIWILSRLFGGGRRRDDQPR